MKYGIIERESFLVGIGASLEEALNNAGNQIDCGITLDSIHKYQPSGANSAYVWADISDQLAGRHKECAERDYRIVYDRNSDCFRLPEEIKQKGETI